MNRPEPQQFVSTPNLTTQSFRCKRLGDVVVKTPSVHRSCRRGFTLIEVVLTIAMLVLLVSVFSATMFGTVGSRMLDEGAYQFDTMLRMARADAANKGRRLRLTFTPDLTDAQNDNDLDVTASTIRFEWEPQPLAQPGEFNAYENGSWTRTLPKSLVIVKQCELTGESAFQTLTYDGELMTDGGALEGLQSVNFYPDGSSDSAVFTLISADKDDNRTALIELDGINGSIQTRLLSPTELDAYMSEKAEATKGNRAY